MSQKINLKENYTLARCCSPAKNDSITGYYSHDNHLKVHHRDCPNLAKAEPGRLVELRWDEIVEAPSFQPGKDYYELDQIDFAVLKHHLDYDIDYSLMVAKMLELPKQEAFDRHKKLRALKLLQRVEAVMVQYRKGVVDNKWIKHRNHSYYRLTDKGKRYLTFHLKSRE